MVRGFDWCWFCWINERLSYSSLNEFQCFFFWGGYVVGEVPTRVGSPEGGSHKGGNMRAFPTGGEHTSTGNLKVCFKFLFFLNFFFSFPPFFPSCFFKFSWSVPFLLVFFNFPDPSHQKNLFMGTWERTNIGGFSLNP
jgi:hypothetical protein